MYSWTNPDGDSLVDVAKGVISALDRLRLTSSWRLPMLFRIQETNDESFDSVTAGWPACSVLDMDRGDACGRRQEPGVQRQLRGSQGRRTHGLVLRVQRGRLGDSQGPRRRSQGRQILPARHQQGRVGR